MKRPAMMAGDAGHGVDDVADHPGERVPVVHQVGGRENPQGDGEQRGQTDLLDGSDDGRPGPHGGDRRRWPSVPTCRR